MCVCVCVAVRVCTCTKMLLSKIRVSTSQWSIFCLVSIEHFLSCFHRAFSFLLSISCFCLFILLIDVSCLQAWYSFVFSLIFCCYNYYITCLIPRIFCQVEAERKPHITNTWSVKKKKSLFFVSSRVNSKDEELTLLGQWLTE